MQQNSATKFAKEGNRHFNTVLLQSGQSGVGVNQSMPAHRLAVAIFNIAEDSYLLSFFVFTTVTTSMTSFVDVMLLWML